MSPSNDRFFRNFFIPANRKSQKKYFFHVSFWWLTWDMNPGFMSNKPKHYPLDNGDFELKILSKINVSLESYSYSIFLKDKKK